MPCSLVGVLKVVLLSFLLVSVPRAWAEDIYDPIEPVNRAIFSFNDTVDVYLFEPVAKGYEWILPGVVRKGVTNFFSNLRSPIYVVSDIVQLKFGQVGTHTGRFLINSTVGVAGVFDVAKLVGLEEHYEDFGVALGHYGIPPGPYIVIPFLGPSNVRDGFGRIVDAFLTPTYYIESLPVALGIRGLEGVNDRADLIEAVELAKENSLDYYSFSQAAYYQVRKGYIYDGTPPEEDEFYDEFDDEFDEEEEELE